MKLSISKAIPSLFTISAFIFGFNAIKLAIDGNIKYAIFSVIIASILDLFDGRVARMLGTDSKFGAELDSLSDLVCFGIAASFIVLYFTESTDKLLFMSVCFFSICAMIRLARFNVDVEYPSYYKNFFVGVPTPAGFVLSILPICISYSFDISIPVLFYTVYMFVVGFLMISMLPTPSTKGIKIHKYHLPAILALIGLILAGMYTFTWLVFSIVGIIYILSIILSAIIVVKLKSEMARKN